MPKTTQKCMTRCTPSKIRFPSRDVAVEFAQLAIDKGYRIKIQGVSGITDAPPAARARLMKLAKAQVAENAELAEDLVQEGVWFVLEGVGDATLLQEMLEEEGWTVARRGDRLRTNAPLTRVQFHFLYAQKYGHRYEQTSKEIKRLGAGLRPANQQRDRGGRGDVEPRGRGAPPFAHPGPRWRRRR